MSKTLSKDVEDLWRLEMGLNLYDLGGEGGRLLKFVCASAPHM